MASLIYLASPYSHVSLAIRHRRFLSTRLFTIKALQAGHAIFSPIVYGEDMATSIGTAFEPWQTINDTVIEKCDEVWVLCLEDWKYSRGVKHELELASSLDKPIHFFTSWGVKLNVDP